MPAVAEILASDRLSEFSGTLIDPNSSKGTVSAVVTLGLPIKARLTKADTTYSITADLGGFAADRLVMNQKLEANTLKVIANNPGLSGQGRRQDQRPAGLARLSQAERRRCRHQVAGDARRCQPRPARLRSRSRGQRRHSGQADRARSDGDHDSRLGIEADLTQLKLDNILPGWVKVSGKASHAIFNVVQKQQSTRLEDIVIDGGGVSIKGSLEVDQNGDLINANFPIYSPSEGDKTSLRAERGADGVLKVTMRGDVFDGRGFLKSAMSGKETDPKSKSKNIDFDVDLKLGAVAGFNGEAVRSVDVKMSRRNGVIRSFALTGKLGRDTPLTRGSARPRAGARGDLSRDQRCRRVASASPTPTPRWSAASFSWRWIRRPRSPARRKACSTSATSRVKGEAALDRVAAGGPGGAQSGVCFSRLRAEFTRQNGQLTIREGVVKGPMIGATIEGSIDYPGNQVRMSGTFVPMYGLNNMFGQIPIVGLFLGGGSNEGLIGVTYEVVGTPGQPVLRVNPISAMAPGVFRKIFEFNTGKQNNPVEFPPNN